MLALVDADANVRQLVAIPSKTSRVTRKRRAALRLLIFLGILATGSVFYVHPVYQLAVHALLLAHVTRLLLVERRHISGKAWRAWVRSQLLWAAILGIQFILVPGNPSAIQSLYLLALIYAASATALIYTGRGRDFTSDLYFVLQLLLYHSLIGFVLGIVIRSSLTPFHEPLFTYHNLFYYVATRWSVLAIGPIEVLRNSGIFWEPGILQIYLNILLFLTLFIVRSRQTMVLAMAAILTTWSTTGLAIMAMQFVWWYASQKKNRLLLLPLILLVSVSLYSVMKQNIYEKVQGDRAMSYKARVTDAEIFYEIIKKHPIVGIGIDHHTRREMVMDYETDQGIALAIKNNARAGNSNSILVLFASFGIFLAPVFLFMMYRQSLIKQHAPVLFAILLLSLVTEPLCFMVFFLMFSSSGLMSLLMPLPLRSRRPSPSGTCGVVMSH